VLETKLYSILLIIMVLCVNNKISLCLSFSPLMTSDLVKLDKSQRDDNVSNTVTNDTCVKLDK